MRELTPEECEFIAGGLKAGSISTYSTEEPPPIVVVATPPPPPYYPPPYYPPPPPPPPYYPPSGGGGGYTPPPPPPPPPIGCADGEAVESESEIEAKTDDNRKEYGSFVRVGTDNVITHTPVFAGSGDQITADVLRQQIIANGITPQQMLGMTHNHPADQMRSTQEFNINRYPSQADWDHATWAVTDYMKNVPDAAQKYSLYILGPDGVMREYPYSSKDYYLNMMKNNPEYMTRSAGVGLPGATKACGS